MPTGWVLAELGVFTRPAVRVIRLHLDTGSGFGRTPSILLPVNPRGRVREVIRLPPGTRGLGLALGVPRDQPIEMTPFCLRRVNLAGRLLLYLQRVLPAYRQVPADQRRRFGVTPGRTLLDLPRAYRAVSRLRRQSAPPYRRWLRQHDTLSNLDRKRIRADMSRRRDLPRFWVLVLLRGDGRAGLDATLAAVRAQIYRRFSVLVLDTAGVLADSSMGQGALSDLGVDARLVPAGAIDKALRQLDASLAAPGGATYVVVLGEGDRLAEHALYWIAVEASAHPDAGLFYSDEDRCQADGSRSAPRFKPDWSPTLQCCGNYLGQATAIRSEVWLRSGGPATGASA